MNVPLSTGSSASRLIVFPLTPVRYSVLLSMREGEFDSPLVAVTPGVPSSVLRTSGESAFPFAMETT